MFGIGLPELILIMAIALIVVGPEKLPELAKTLARQVLELKRAANTLQESLREEDTKAKMTSEPLSQVRELVSQSPRALPGDQWVHEQAPMSPVLNPPEPSPVVIQPAMSDGAAG